MNTIVTGSCSAMGQEIIEAIAQRGNDVEGWCRCKGVDLSKKQPPYDRPLFAVVHVAETGLVGLYNVWDSTRDHLVNGSAFVLISSVHHLNHDDHYAKSKRDQESAVRDLAKSHPHIRINTLRLGHVAGTGAWPQEVPEKAKETVIGRFGSVEEVSEAVLFLVFHRWITGTVLTLDGGMSLKI